MPAGALDFTGALSDYWQSLYNTAWGRGVTPRMPGIGDRLATDYNRFRAWRDSNILLQAPEGSQWWDLADRYAAELHLPPRMRPVTRIVKAAESVFEIGGVVIGVAAALYLILGRRK